MKYLLVRKKEEGYKLDGKYNSRRRSCSSGSYCSCERPEMYVPMEPAEEKGEK